MRSFDGTVLSQATTTGVNNAGQNTQQQRGVQHTSRLNRQEATSSSPPSSDGSCRRLHPPAILCKVFVQGIGWGSQVCLHLQTVY